MASGINKLDVVMFSILSNTRTGVGTFIETSRQWIEKEGCKVHLIYIVDVKYGLPKVKNAMEILEQSYQCLKICLHYLY